MQRRFLARGPVQAAIALGTLLVMAASRLAAAAPAQPPRSCGSGYPAPSGEKESGYLPVDCIPLAVNGSPFLLDCWLEHHPRIADAISWTWQSRTGAKVAKHWKDWSSARRTALRQAYVDAKAWYANGMADFPGTLVEDPPANKNEPWIEHTGFTVLANGSQAWPIYLGHVALSLATEINGWVPWSIRGLDDAALADLLGANEMFFQTYDMSYVVYRGMAVKGGTPSNATTVREFLKDHRLVGKSALSTVACMLDWSRWNLRHVIGSTGWENLQNYYQYKGASPIIRILEGTVAEGPGIPSVGHAHWTAGCGGTKGLLAWVLRTVNIPVHQMNVNGHALPYFPSIERYLSHGDDPYDALMKTSEIAAKRLLIGQRQFDRWFTLASDEEAAENVGRRPRQLSIPTPPPYVVSKYCQDVIDGKSHADGQVFDIYDSDYTLAALEATGLWDRLAERAAVSTDWPCDQLP